MIRTEINELINSVHGAVIARIQLGFDEVEMRPWNLKPIIVSIRNQVEKHPGPMISGKPPGTTKAQGKAKPPLAITNRLS